MSNSVLIGVDPGKSTGIAFWSPQTDEFTSMELEHFEALDYLSARLRPQAGNATPIAVWCENYIITVKTAKLTAQPWSLKAIGTLEWLCRGFGVPFYLRTASQSKKFSTDDKLKNLDWFRPTKDGHANDGARLLLLGAVDLDLIDLRRLING